MRIFRYILVMWTSFALLFSLSILVLELMEGSKITTTEYYGLRNIGIVFIGMIGLTASLIYPATLMPLSWLLRTRVMSAAARITLYTFLGGICGVIIFDWMYDDYFVKDYDLKVSSAVIIFSAFGLLYALADQFSILRAVEK
ncbi:hypothetical protein [Paenibacillus hamazuiensis]|uniref:hypothetical protein n=1 Tax=Paenibacillus hamazuiensis TaxID=2936508 RepID=UPI00200CB342|nr:hypothetical protein [Paenibacillus hamazuiensis]